jgi:hypothetical protein
MFLEIAVVVGSVLLLAILWVALCCYRRVQYDTQALRLSDRQEALEDVAFQPTPFSENDYPVPPGADAAFLPPDADIGSQAFPSVTTLITSEFEYQSD